MTPTRFSFGSGILRRVRLASTSGRTGSAWAVWGFALATGLVLMMACPDALTAQAPASGPPTQMRHFWHVFAAFAIAWLLIFGWAVSIARRLARLEKILDR